MYKYILFDLDGTLTDPKEGITKCVQHALKHFEVDEPDLDNLTRFIGPSLKYSFMTYYNFDAEQAHGAIEKYRERFREVGMFENGVYEGIEDLLKELRSEGKKLALATSKPHEFAEKILTEYNLRQYFDVVVGSELDGRRSDKDEVITEVLHQLGLSEQDKKETVMIGDRKYDILGAKACGIASIGVTFGYAEPGELEKAEADYIIKTVEGLGNILKH